MLQVKKAPSRVEAADAFKDGTADITVVENGAGFRLPGQYYCHAYAKDDAAAEHILAKGWDEVAPSQWHRCFYKYRIHADEAVDQLNQ